MKNTHSVTDVEGLINEKLDILKNGKTKEEKRKARKEIIRLERFYNDINSKITNGKKYPNRLPGYKSDVPMDKEEIYRLIDSVPSIVDDWFRNKYSGKIDEKEIKKELDTSGVSVGKNRFVFEEKGW